MYFLRTIAKTNSLKLVEPQRVSGKTLPQNFKVAAFPRLDFILEYSLNWKRLESSHPTDIGLAILDSTIIRKIPNYKKKKLKERDKNAKSI